MGINPQNKINWRYQYKTLEVSKIVSLSINTLLQVWNILQSLSATRFHTVQSPVITSFVFVWWRPWFSLLGRGKRLTNCCDAISCQMIGNHDVSVKWHIVVMEFPNAGNFWSHSVDPCVASIFLIHPSRRHNWLSIFRERILNGQHPSYQRKQSALIWFWTYKPLVDAVIAEYAIRRFAVLLQGRTRKSKSHSRLWRYLKI